MVIEYVCTAKCYFGDAIRNEGDKVFVDHSIGDSFPHLRRAEGQAITVVDNAPEEESKAPEQSGAKASSSTKKAKVKDDKA